MSNVYNTMPPSPKNTNNLIERPPVVVVMGHIDHGKSTLLDFLRKTNVVAKEAGGITQHTYAYEFIHTGETGEEGGKRVTFLDTPGHEAFTLMRERGTSVADIAVLVVAADDGVKPQTLEALGIIKKSGLPYIVAINKIDKPNANVDKVKQELAEHEVYLEGYGGGVPVVAISAKTGEHVSELLTMILLVAEMGEWKGDPQAHAEGIVIEAHQDPQKGITATLVIKNGVLKKKMSVTAGACTVPVRSIADMEGKELLEAMFSTPISLAGWSCLPQAGASFKSFENKKEAEKEALKTETTKRGSASSEEAGKTTIPLVLKADTRGTLDALAHETEKVIRSFKETLGADTEIRILEKGVGTISESDVKLVGRNERAIIAGFNVLVDGTAKDAAERQSVSIGTFPIIYELIDWLRKEIEKKRPRVRVEEITGRAKIIRIFSNNKNKQVVGGKVFEGKLVVGGNVKILRRDFAIGNGELLELQQQKTKTKEVPEGSEFGALIEARYEIAPGDVIEEFVIVEK